MHSWRYYTQIVRSANLPVTSNTLILQFLLGLLLKTLFDSIDVTNSPTYLCPICSS